MRPFNGAQNLWHNYHYALTHAPNKNSNNQGRSLNVVKVILHAIRNCSLRKNLLPLGISHFEMSRK